jgi:hypothetical protein
VGCNCAKKRTQTGRAARALNSPKSTIRYEVFGGDLMEPESFEHLSAARDHAAQYRAKVRSIVVGETVAATG